MRCIKWCHLQCPLTNSDLFSRSHHSLTLKISNGYRYGHSYYRRQIGYRIQAFEWHQFQWPWVTLSRSRGYYRCHRCIVCADDARSAIAKFLFLREGHTNTIKLHLYLVKNKEKGGYKRYSTLRSATLTPFVYFSEP